MFPEFVRMLDTIFGWNKPETAGFLPTAPCDYDCAFEGFATLSGCTCMRLGRANRVAILSRNEKNNPIPLAATLQTQQDGTKLRRSDRIRNKGACGSELGSKSFRRLNGANRGECSKLITRFSND
jgi:hypothetical protein